MSDVVRDDIRQRLADLAEENGGVLTPSMVVEDAKDRDSPLHDQFEWNLRAAAMQRWLDRARELIRSVRIDVRTDTSVVRVPAYVRDPRADDRSQGYVGTASLRTDADLARVAIVREFARAAAALRRAKDLAAALGEDARVDAAIGAVSDATRRFDEGPRAQ